jgi:hypothetical protein
MPDFRVRVEVPNQNHFIHRHSCISSLMLISNPLRVCSSNSLCVPKVFSHIAEPAWKATPIHPFDDVYRRAVLPLHAAPAFQLQFYLADDGYSPGFRLDPCSYRQYIPRMPPSINAHVLLSSPSSSPGSGIWICNTLAAHSCVRRIKSPKVVVSLSRVHPAKIIGG